MDECPYDSPSDRLCARDHVPGGPYVVGCTWIHDDDDPFCVPDYDFSYPGYDSPAC
jgi:hypothetical protein